MATHIHQIVSEILMVLVILTQIPALTTRTAKVWVCMAMMIDVNFRCCFGRHTTEESQQTPLEKPSSSIRNVRTICEADYGISMGLR